MVKVVNSLSMIVSSPEIRFRSCIHTFLVVLRTRTRLLRSPQRFLAEASHLYWGAKPTRRRWSKEAANLTLGRVLNRGFSRVGTWVGEAERVQSRFSVKIIIFKIEP